MKDHQRSYGESSSGPPNSLASTTESKLYCFSSQCRGQQGGHPPGLASLFTRGLGIFERVVERLSKVRSALHNAPAGIVLAKADGGFVVQVAGV